MKSAIPTRRRPISVIAVVGGTVVAMTVAATGPSAADPPINISAPASLPCAVAKTVAPITGVLVLDSDGAGAATPAPGQSVSLIIDKKVGPPQHMSLFRHADGTLEIEGCGEEDASNAYGEPTQVDSASVLSSPSECSDSTYGLNGRHWTHTFHWSYQAATTPANLTTAQATGAIQDAVLPSPASTTTAGWRHSSRVGSPPSTTARSRVEIASLTPVPAAASSAEPVSPISKT